MSVLILSPHCDDAPLSLGAALCAGRLGPDVLVAVVFTQSRFTLRQRGTAPLAETSRLRMREETCAAAAAGYRVAFLPFAEAGVRPGLATAREILDPGRDPHADPAWSCVSTTIRELLGLTECLTLAPLGCTAHVDHRLVSFAAREALAANPSLPLLFYEELPYAARLDPASLTRLLPAADERGPFEALALAGGSLEAKLRVLGAYQSQIDEICLGGMREHWLRAGAERVWGRRADLLRLDAPAENRAFR